MRLAQAYDLIGFDLDGVIYRGPEVIAGAPEVVAALKQMGLRVGFVTNNSARSPAQVAAALTGMGIPADPADVVTSAQATARIMAEALPAGSEVFALGTAALADELTGVGLNPVRRRSARTAAICFGFDPTLTWEDFNQAVYAVQGGAAWYACNDDLTRPTEQGIGIGTGGMLQALRQALPGLEPIMGGKPARPLLDETHRRLGGDRLLFVGDRLDTDVAGARVAGWDSLFVLSGAHTRQDLVVAPPGQHPTYIGQNVRALLEPPRRPA